MQSTLTSPVLQQNPFLARLRQMPFVSAMDAFFLSPAYFLTLGLLTVLANAFALEFLTYGIFVLIAVYICLFGQDLLPVMPLVVCCYIVPSRENNPGVKPDSFFYTPGGSAAIIAMAALVVIALLIRLALDPELGRLSFFKAKRQLLPGILALGGAYLLAGAGSGHYFDHGTGNIVFAAVQFLAIGLMYCIFTATVRWNKAPEDYFGRIGLMVGFILLAEVAIMYVLGDPFAKGKLDRNTLYTGWGNYNCMGGLLTMMIPFPFQMALTKKHGWLYCLVGTAFLGGVILSCSRTSIVIAVFIYAVSLLYLLLKSEHRKTYLTIILSLFTVLAAYLLIFQFDLVVSYLKIFTIVRSIFSRTDGFVAGIQQFLDYPILGGGFYPVEYPLEEWSKVETFTSFFPGLWHNTIIQMLASCGIVGLAAYSFHRIQTINLIRRKHTVANMCIAFSGAAMLLMSLFDCHIFNIGPALFYSMSMAFAEKYEAQE